MEARVSEKEAGGATPGIACVDPGSLKKIGPTRPQGRCQPRDPRSVRRTLRFLNILIYCSYPNFNHFSRAREKLRARFIKTEYPERRYRVRRSVENLGPGTDT